MKRIVVLILFLTGFFIIGFAENNNQISANNEFGGATWQTEYNSGDKFYKDGILKSTAFYDSKQKLKVADYIYTESYAKQKSLVRQIQFFSDQQKVTQMKFYYNNEYGQNEGYTNRNETYYPNSDPEATEYLYTEEFSKKYGYYRSMTTYNIGHYIRDWEYNFTETWAKKVGYYKRVDHYVYVGSEKKETLTEKVYYDKDGKETKRETVTDSSKN